jgi:hypothetical protein
MSSLVNKLLCVSCVAALTLLAVDATPLAILVMASENPEAVSTCLALCYVVALS